MTGSGEERETGRRSSPRERPPRGRLVVISGPSGVGKSTVVRRLAERWPFVFSVSATTRPPRPGETDGVHYRFVDPETFARLRDEGELLEWAEYAGHLYGTPASAVLEALERGENVLLDIEVHGARQIRRRFPDAILIFLAPPDLDTLAHRLRARGDTDEEAIARRLAIARWQLEEAAPEFDHVVVNDDVERAVDEIVRILAGTADEQEVPARATGQGGTAPSDRWPPTGHGPAPERGEPA